MGFEFKRAALAGLVLAVVMAAGLMWFKSPWGAGLERHTPALSAQSYDYVCAACSNKFSLTRPEVLKLVKAGQTRAVEGELLRVPCPKCGKVEAKLDETVPR